MIVTFYSYKGGVGRSMAMANVAAWLVRRGLRVVVIDWDLEAPGLETFFLDDHGRADVRGSVGLIDILEMYKRQLPLLPREAAQSGASQEQGSIAKRWSSPTDDFTEVLQAHLPPLEHALLPVPLEGTSGSGGRLLFLPSGARDGDRFREYARTVQEFDWADFYRSYRGEDYFEWMRQELSRSDLADIVLIDSRTGVTEMGGVCTRHLADVIVALCAPNIQNITGIQRMAASFDRDDIKEVRRGRPVDVVVVPARVETGEGDQLNNFKREFLDRFDGWSPPVLGESPETFWDLRIPYVPYYAYSESLAVQNPDHAAAEKLVPAYQGIGAALGKLAVPREGAVSDRLVMLGLETTSTVPQQASRPDGMRIEDGVLDRWPTLEEHFDAPGPKRILALDGRGGVRALISLAYLQRMEEVLGQRYGISDFRLCDYFDLIAGASTGSIVAACLSIGMRVGEIIDAYATLSHDVFRRRLLQRWLFPWKPQYDGENLSLHLQRLLGPETKFGGPEIKTGLLILTKRLDTNSPWPIGNNPTGKYFRSSGRGRWAGSAEFSLWRLVGASTAVPMYFDPLHITVAEGEEPGEFVTGEFVSGDMSWFGNPSLQALMYATLSGFGVNWKTGADELQLVSVGTGAFDDIRPSGGNALYRMLRALTSVLDDCSVLVETMMQWMSNSRSARVLVREVGDLGGDLLCRNPLMTYRRYDQEFTAESMRQLGFPMAPKDLQRLKRFDDASNVQTLMEVGELVAAESVRSEDFGEAFDVRVPTLRSM